MCVATPGAVTDLFLIRQELKFSLEGEGSHPEEQHCGNNLCVSEADYSQPHSGRARITRRMAASPFPALQKGRKGQSRAEGGRFLTNPEEKRENCTTVVGCENGWFCFSKSQLELWFPEISAPLAFCGLSKAVEKSMLPKPATWGRVGGEQLSCNRRACLWEVPA